MLQNVQVRPMNKHIVKHVSCTGRCHPDTEGVSSVLGAENAKHGCNHLRLKTPISWPLLKDLPVSLYQSTGTQIRILKGKLGNIQTETHVCCPREFCLLPDFLAGSKRSATVQAQTLTGTGTGTRRQSVKPMSDGGEAVRHVKTGMLVQASLDHPTNNHSHNTGTPSLSPSLFSPLTGITPRGRVKPKKDQTIYTKL